MLRVEITTSAANYDTAFITLNGKIGGRTYELTVKVVPLHRYTWVSSLPAEMNGDAPSLAAYDEICLLISSPPYPAWWIQSHGYKVEIGYSVRG